MSTDVSYFLCIIVRINKRILNVKQHTAPGTLPLDARIGMVFAGLFVNCMMSLIDFLEKERRESEQE